MGMNSNEQEDMLADIKERDSHPIRWRSISGGNGMYWPRSHVVREGKTLCGIDPVFGFGPTTDVYCGTCVHYLKERYSILTPGSNC